MSVASQKLMVEWEVSSNQTETNTLQKDVTEILQN